MELVTHKKFKSGRLMPGWRSRSATGPYIDRAEFSMMDGGGTVIAIGDGKKWPKFSL